LPGEVKVNILRKNSSPRYRRDNITSYLLVSERTCNSKKLAITLVEMETGGIQRIHSHEPEQMYYILEGSGTMTVEGEQKRVKAGDCIFFASFSEHGLENTGDAKLKYLSAASPSFTKEECERFWPLKSLEND
jgi:mannose-6-phosphate isomerase-like protein (cupin superfamily)